MKNKWLYRLGCLILTGSMLFTSTWVSRAAETEQRSGQSAEADAEQLQTDESAGVPEETEKPQEPEDTNQSEKVPVPETGSGDAPDDSQNNTPADGNMPGSKENGGKGKEDEKELVLPQSGQGPEGAGDKVEDTFLAPGDDVPEMKEEGNTIHKPDGDTEQEDHSDSAADYTSNIVAGNDVYLNRLSDTYGLRFGASFEEVMDGIESNYREFLEKPEEFLAENWQDVLAVYMMKCGQKNGLVTVDEECRDELEKIFFLMNLRSNSAMLGKLEKDKNQTKEESEEKEYYALTVKEYAVLYGATKSEKKILEKYTSTECRQLCAIITAAKGFVRGEVGENVSEERIAIVSAACSLVGRVGYFWGGKSYAMGWDDRWGSPMTVSAEGSRSSGTVRSYGLDCSGFAAWSYYNGLNGSDAGIGSHTTTQWDASEMVEEGNAKPGDLVFYRPGSAGDDNHVGIVIGVNSDGSLLVVHCSSGQNGVVTGEAWSSGFKYVRSPINLK